MPLQSLTLLIQEHAERLSPTDRQIADLVLSFPGELASYSATELARMSGTSNAAVTRFVRRIGFRSYEEMKHHVRDIRRTGSPAYLMEKESVGTIGDQIKRHMLASLGNIENTFADLDPDALSEAVEGIATARRVAFIGMRNGHFLAKYLRWQVSECRGGTELLPRSGETLAESLVDLGADDVLVIFAIRRIVPSMRAVLALTKTLKCRTLIVADHFFHTDVRATWLLTCATRSPSPLDNHVSVLLLCHIIADELLQSLNAAGRKRLVAIEDMHLTIGEM
jgi:DNA-binding MurR/RpiR family transcriptional regulator